MTDTTILAVGAITLAAMEITGQARSDIMGQSRKPALVRIRQAIILVAKENNPPSLSYPTIGYRLGGRDHSTIIHSYHEAKRKLAHDPSFAGLVANIEKRAREIGPNYIFDCGKAPERLNQPIKVELLPPKPHPAIKKPDPSKPPLPFPSDRIINVDVITGGEKCYVNGMGNFMLDKDGVAMNEKLDHNAVVIAVWKLGCAIIEARKVG